MFNQLTFTARGSTLDVRILGLKSTSSTVRVNIFIMAVDPYDKSERANDKDIYDDFKFKKNGLHGVCDFSALTVKPQIIAIY